MLKTSLAWCFEDQESQWNITKICVCLGPWSTFTKPDRVDNVKNKHCPQNILTLNYKLLKKWTIIPGAVIRLNNSLNNGFMTTCLIYFQPTFGILFLSQFLMIGCFRNNEKMNNEKEGCWISVTDRQLSHNLPRGNNSTLLPLVVI